MLLIRLVRLSLRVLVILLCGCCVDLSRNWFSDEKGWSLCEEESVRVRQRTQILRATRIPNPVLSALVRRGRSTLEFAAASSFRFKNVSAPCVSLAYTLRFLIPYYSALVGAMLNREPITAEGLFAVCHHHQPRPSTGTKQCGVEPHSSDLCKCFFGCRPCASGLHDRHVVPVRSGARCPCRFMT